MEAAAMEKAARMEAKIAKMSKPSTTSPRPTVDIDKRLDQVSHLLLHAAAAVSASASAF